MKRWSLVLCLVVLVACTRSTRTVELSDPELAPTSDMAQGMPAVAPEYAQVEFSPGEAEYFDLVSRTLQFNEEELTLLRQNGFVVTDRLQWKRFKEAYAWIYWQDLPVLVTTDSILQAIHDSYSELLGSMELRVAGPILEDLLTQTADSVRSALSQNQEPALTEIYEDVLVYLQVPLALLRGEPGPDAEVSAYVRLAENADGVYEVPLFDICQDPGSVEPCRVVDFTQFKPRAHYVSSTFHQNYFRAMSWLAHVDFRLVGFDAYTSEPQFNPKALVAAMILREHLYGAKQDRAWQQLDELLAILVGRSDNMTLTDLERYLTDMQPDAPMDVLERDQATLLRRLLDHDYGQQRITGQIVARHNKNTSQEPVPRPISFMLLGQRFAVDSYVMSSLVYDRLFVDNEPVARRFPATMDVMYVLGNDSALAHLQSELEEYQYRPNLDSLRVAVDRTPPEFWQEPVYNQWLGLLRTLNQRPQSTYLPLSMQTRAWADRILSTQLASWAQLRHDNILYVEQSYTTANLICEYPAGYVEPYPEFYRAVLEFAASDYERLAQLGPLMSQAGPLNLEFASTYFKDVMNIMQQLETLADKELGGEPFTAEEEAFLKSIVRHQSREFSTGCVTATEVHWDGWYPTLFYMDEKKPAVVADVHTNPTTSEESSLYPPGVLHVASGPVVPIVVIVNTDEGDAMYVGPAMTYFEFVEEGYPYVRLNDEEWQARLSTPPYPTAPAWTTSFRLPTRGMPKVLELPTE